MDAHVAREALSLRTAARALRRRYAPVLAASDAKAVKQDDRDPATIALERAVADMQAGLVEAKKQTAIAIADEKRLEKQCENERALAVAWHEKGMLAVRADNDDLARQAIARAREHEELAVAYDATWQQQKRGVGELKRALQALNGRVEEAKRKRNLLVARAKRVEARRTIDVVCAAPGAAFAAAAAVLEERIERAAKNLGERAQENLE
jgi:phage shock protein A